MSRKPGHHWWATTLRAVWVLISVIGLAASAWTVRSWASDPSLDSRLVAQGRHLLALTGPGSAAARDMQAYFPEGEFFTQVLTGIGLARLASPALYPDIPQAVRDEFRQGAWQTLLALENPDIADRFGQIDELESGVFFHGWRLQVINALVDAGMLDLRHDQLIEAQNILWAIDDSPAGWVQAYPGGYWPCDTVVGLAAVSAVLPDDAQPVIQRWMGVVKLDDATGLLPHQVQADGQAIEGPRGSSQAIIQTFWPSLAGGDPRQWASFKHQFVARHLGVVAVREYPIGVDGRGDVDSGPLIGGLSLAASAVGLAAARANGDMRLAAALDHEIEWLAVGATRSDQRAYAVGALPVADAFILWAKTTPVPETPAGDVPNPSPTWWLWAVVFAVPAITYLIVTLTQRRRRGVAHS